MVPQHGCRCGRHGQYAGSEFGEVAEIAYATLAMVTDYDCWRPGEAPVSAEMAIANLMSNAGRAQLVAAAAIRIIGKEHPSSIAHEALRNGLISQPGDMAAATRRRMGFLLDGKMGAPQ